MCSADESDYDYYEGYVKGMSLLMSLLRMRIRLKNCGQAHSISSN